MSYCPDCARKDHEIVRLQLQLYQALRDLKLHQQEALKYVQRLIQIEDVIMEGRK